MPHTIHGKHVASTIRRVSTARIPPPAASRRSNPSAGHARLIEGPRTPKRRPAPVSVSKALAWTFSSMLAGGMAFYSTRLYLEARKPVQNPAIVDLAQQKDVSGRYEDTADNFDSDVGVSEMLMGINKLRKRLAKKCTGHVLEVSCGTGRNLGYFNIGRDANIESLTFIDLSPQMIEVCKKKWNVFMSAKKDRLKPGLQVRFLKGSALGEMPSAPGEKKYDTIIQTMGLCSTPSPVELLTNMVKYLDTSNPDSRILLLEHGRSYRSWLNRILDNSAEKHAEIYGCWFNRDIGALVEDAARQTGLEVVNERRRHLGTTWVFELKPSQDLMKKTLVKQSSNDGSMVKQSSDVGSLFPEQQQSSSWWNWVGWK